MVDDMELQAGDQVVIEQRGHVVSVLRDADVITGYEIRLKGSPTGETWLVPAGTGATNGPCLRRAADGTE